CDTVVILDAGRVLKHGSVNGLRARRHDRYRLQIDGNPQGLLGDLALEGVDVLQDNGRGELRVRTPADWTTRTFFALAEHHHVVIRALERDDEDLQELFHRVLAEGA